MRHRTDTLRKHSLDVSGFAGSRSSFTFICGVQCSTTAIYWEFCLLLFPHKQQEKLKYTLCEKRDVSTGLVHATNILKDVTDTAYSTTLWL